MTRITQGELSRNIIADVLANHVELERAGEEVSSGYKVRLPGDNDTAGQISDFRNAVQRIDSFKQQVSPITGLISFQEEIVRQSTDLLIRANEIATESANETLSPTARQTMSGEVLQIRNQLIALANSTYQGRYIYSGAASGTPPFSAATYAAPASGDAALRYVYTSQAGATFTNSVNISDSQSVVMNTPGSEVFNNSIQALERLGRALSGYRTNPASGTPDGTGAAYVFPAEYSQQTTDIRGSIDLLNAAMNNDLLTERTDLGARLSRLQSTGAMLDSAKAGAEDALNNLQNADSVTAMTRLQQAQFALQASMAVSAKVLNLSILDYL